MTNEQKNSALNWGLAIVIGIVIVWYVIPQQRQLNAERDAYETRKAESDREYDQLSRTPAGREVIRRVINHGR